MLSKYAMWTWWFVLVHFTSALRVHKKGLSGGPAFIQQSEQFERLSKSSDWLGKSRPPKTPHSFWTSKQAILLLFNMFFFFFRELDIWYHNGLQNTLMLCLKILSRTNPLTLDKKKINNHIISYDNKLYYFYRLLIINNFRVINLIIQNKYHLCTVVCSSNVAKREGSL